MKQLSPDEKDQLIVVLRKRFEENMHRHPTLIWTDIEEKLNNQPNKLRSLFLMEETGGMPDVVGDNYIYIDCSAESPRGRRSYCYDLEALNKRKKNKPEHDVMTAAAELGVELLTEKEYRYLQSLEEFDLTTSSWVKTPAKIRELNGALFCDRRYDTVFVYHNGADSYYGSRGFRGKLTL